MTAAKAKAPVKEKRRKVVSLDKKKARAGWMFIMPFVLGFIIVYLPIVVDSLKFSFTDIKIGVGSKGGGYTLTWAGIEHYREALFNDTSFIQRLTTGVEELLFDIPAIVVFALFVAVLLNKKMLGRAAFRAIFFIPVILSTGLIDSVAGMGAAGNNYYQGGMVDDGSGSSSAVTQIISLTDLSWLFRNMQVGTEILEYVIGVVNDIYNIINRSGVQMLIFLAGLQSISPAIYESCSIDGATGWETFWKITFPMISPMILVNAIYTVIDAFTSSNNTIMAYIKGKYIDIANGGREVATAMSWIYFIIVIGIVLVVTGIMSAYIFYQRRD